MKRMKQTACLVLAVLCLALLPLTSFAAEMSESYIAAMQGVAESLIPTTMSLAAGEDLETNLTYAVLSGDEVGAQIYTNWGAVAEETGVYQAMEVKDVGMNDDGSYYVTSTVTCEQKDVEVKIVVNPEFTEITSMTFDVVKTFGEKMENAALNLLLGMGTVFLVLIFLMFIISLFKYVPGFADKLTGKAKAAPAAPAPAAPVSAPAAAPAAAVQDDSELVAVIAAAIAAYEGTSADGLVVRSIRRVNKSNWKR